MKARRQESLSPVGERVRNISDLDAEVDRMEAERGHQIFLTRSEATKVLQDMGHNFPKVDIAEDAVFGTPKRGMENSGSCRNVVVIGIIDKQRQRTVANLVIDDITGVGEIKDSK